VRAPCARMRHTAAFSHHFETRNPNLFIMIGIQSSRYTTMFHVRSFAYRT